MDEEMVECIVKWMDILVVEFGMEMAPRRAWRLRGCAGIWPRKKGSGMERSVLEEELEFWLELGSRAQSVSWRLADRSTSVNRQPTEFSSVPFTETCFVTGNHRSAIGQPNCTTSVDRQSTVGSSVPFPEWWFSVRKSDGQPSVSCRSADTDLLG